MAKLAQIPAPPKGLRVAQGAPAGHAFTFSKRAFTELQKAAWRPWSPSQSPLSSSSVEGGGISMSLESACGGSTMSVAPSLRSQRRDTEPEHAAKGSLSLPSFAYELGERQAAHRLIHRRIRRDRDAEVAVGAAAEEPHALRAAELGVHLALPAVQHGLLPDVLEAAQLEQPHEVLEVRGAEHPGLHLLDALLLDQRGVVDEALHPLRRLRGHLGRHLRRPRRHGRVHDGTPGGPRSSMLGALTPLEQGSKAACGGAGHAARVALAPGGGAQPDRGPQSQRAGEGAAGDRRERAGGPGSPRPRQASPGLQPRSAA